MNGKEEVKKEEEHEGTLQINETRGAFKFRPNYCLFSKWQEEASMPRLSTWPYEVICCSHDSDSVVRHIPLFVSQNKMPCFLSFHQGGFSEDHSFMMLKGDRTGVDVYRHWNTGRNGSQHGFDWGPRHNAQAPHTLSVHAAWSSGRHGPPRRIGTAPAQLPLPISDSHPSPPSWNQMLPRQLKNSI